MSAACLLQVSRLPAPFMNYLAPKPGFDTAILMSLATRCSALCAAACAAWFSMVGQCMPARCAERGNYNAFVVIVTSRPYGFMGRPAYLLSRQLRTASALQMEANAARRSGTAGMHVYVVFHPTLSLLWRLARGMIFTSVAECVLPPV